MNPESVGQEEAQRNSADLQALMSALLDRVFQKDRAVPPCVCPVLGCRVSDLTGREITALLGHLQGCVLDKFGEKASDILVGQVNVRVQSNLT